MSLSFRFAILSDPHIALPDTIWDNPGRFHLVEVSIPAFDAVLADLAQLDLDFLLIPGDLTQHGEPINHRWLAARLAQLPYPAYVVPGNHDIVAQQPSDYAIGLEEFAGYYPKFGYGETARPYYACEVLPGVTLLGLNSIAFDAAGEQHYSGRLEADQLRWLEDTLATCDSELIMVMIHHNVLEHIPGQSRHRMGQRYMLDNASELLALLRAADVPLIFTGHLHIQDVTQQGGITEITTGSLVSYPHPYRVLHYREQGCIADNNRLRQLKVETRHVTAVPGWDDLATQSREWMGDRSFHFMLRFLTQPPLNVPEREAKSLVPDLRYFWAEVSKGDAQFDFPQFPGRVRRHLHAFNAVDADGNPLLRDNNAVLDL